MSILRLFLSVVVIFILLIWIINSYILVKTKSFIYGNPDQIPSIQVVIVPGASVYRSGKLSPVLHQRVELGIRFLYYRDSVKILFSGFAVPNGYNEPAAMADFAKNRMVAANKILQDSNGTSTYITMLNCKRKYQFNSVLIVTQEYHLPRALYIARHLGLDAYGLIAPSNNVSMSKSILVREISSRIKDFFLLKFFKLFSIHKNSIYEKVQYCFSY